MGSGLQEISRRTLLRSAPPVLAAGVMAFRGRRARAANQTVTIAWTEGLQSLPIYIARAQGFFEKEGVTLDLVNFSSGTSQAAAVMSGSADVYPGSFLQVIKGHTAGGDVVALSNLFAAYPIAIVLTNEAIAKAGITPGMGIDEKVKRLKGFTIGISGPGASTDVFARSLFLARGIDPSTYVKLTTIGDGPTTWAAFQKKLMDGFSNTAPWIELAQAANLGQPVIDPFTGEIPEIADVPYSVNSASKAAIAKKPELFSAYLRGIARALHFARTNPEGVRSVRQYFPNVPEEAFNLAVEKYRKVLPAKLAISHENFDKSLAWMNIGAKDPLKVSFDEVVSSDLAAAADKAVPA